MGTLREQGWDGFAGQMWLQARRTCVPVSGTFELTPLCNFRCRMCYVRLDPERLAAEGRLRTADEWLDLARQAIEMGMYRVTLTGGEVLTRPDFEEIYRGLVEMGLLVTVLSNASLITEDVVRLFEAYRPSKLRFTLYGASNETYERLCGAPGGFDRVMRSLRMLGDAGIPFSLAFTETTENVGDLDAVLDIAEGLQVGVGISAGLFPAVRGATSEAESLTVPTDDRPCPDRPLDNTRRDRLVEYVRGHSTPDEGLFSGLFAECRAYRTSFVVAWDGKMETCTFMSSSDARPFEEGFERAWRHLHERLSRLRLPDRCASCEARVLCQACPGLREAKTGRPDGIPSDLCREARERYESIRQQLEGREVRQR